MNEVTVIGLGAMGSGIARALLEKDYRVTVWNRTRAKAAPLVEAGATLADDPAAAIGASPVLIVCVDNYAVTAEILSAPGADRQMAGKVMVQTSHGTPQEARTAEEWANAHGAEYLDVNIWAYPAQMGTQDARLIVAGSREAHRQSESLLAALAGTVVYYGEQVGAAATLDSAMTAFYYGAFVSMLHGARICEVEGIRADKLADMLVQFMPLINETVEWLGSRIQADDYGDAQATVRTGALGAEALLQHARESGIDTSFPEFVVGLFRKGMQAGLGDEEGPAMIKVLRG
jgi:3-hydroxyisobutyrate dehydrogenase-like beta-hydroxyacid dehydrogenase